MIIAEGAPVRMPITKGKITIPAIAAGDAEPLLPAPLIIEITVKNTMTPITSSIAASGISVRVTGPFVWY